MAHTIRITDDSDPDALASEFRQRIERSDLPDQTRELLVEQVTQTLRMLADQGHKTAQVGSTTTASREIEIGGYDVQIEARFGRRPSLWERLKRLLGR